jgi:DNA-directed RNA polymerase subunit beta
VAHTNSRRILLGPANGAARHSFGRIEEVAPMPNLNQVQRDSFNWFLKEGLKELFAEMSPMDSSPPNAEV